MADIYFAGCESATHLEPLLKHGASHVMLSYAVIRKRGQLPLLLALLDRYPQVKVFIDSGGYAFNPAKVSLDTYFNGYVAFLHEHGRRFTYASEFDAVDYLTPKQRIGFRDDLVKLRTITVVPVWRESDGATTWEQLCDDATFPHLALSASVEDEKRGRLIRTAHAYNKTVHGYAATKILTTLKETPYDTVASTTWKSGERFGVTYIFDHNEFIVLTREQGGKSARKQYKKYYRSIGCDVDKILRDDTEEVRKANIIAWIKLAQRLQTISRFRKKLGIQDNGTANTRRDSGRNTHSVSRQALQAETSGSVAAISGDSAEEAKHSALRRAANPNRTTTHLQTAGSASTHSIPARVGQPSSDRAETPGRNSDISQRHRRALPATSDVSQSVPHVRESETGTRADTEQVLDDGRSDISDARFAATYAGVNDDHRMADSNVRNSSSELSNVPRQSEISKTEHSIKDETSISGDAHPGNGNGARTGTQYVRIGTHTRGGTGSLTGAPGDGQNPEEGSGLGQLPSERRLDDDESGAGTGTRGSEANGWSRRATRLLRDRTEKRSSRESRGSDRRRRQDGETRNSRDRAEGEYQGEVDEQAVILSPVKSNVVTVRLPKRTSMALEQAPIAPVPTVTVSHEQIDGIIPTQSLRRGLIHRPGVPQLQCSNCVMSQDCSEYEEGSVCKFTETFLNIGSRRAEDVMDTMAGLFEDTMLRYQRRRLQEEQTNQGYVDKETTKLGKMAMDQGEKLITLMKGMRRTRITSSGGGGILTKLLGVKPVTEPVTIEVEPVEDQTDG